VFSYQRITKGLGSGFIEFIGSVGFVEFYVRGLVGMLGLS